MDFNQREQGSVLLMILIFVTILGLLAGIAGSTWKTVTQRAKEQELLWRGTQIRQAIESYYKTGHAGMKASFPGSFDDLIRDPRALGVVRHLRKKYLDPMTGEEWQIIRDSKGRLQGVPRGPFILNSASWVCKEAILPNNGKIRLDSCFDVKSGRDLVGLN